MNMARFSVCDHCLSLEVTTLSITFLQKTWEAAKAFSYSVFRKLVCDENIGFLNDCCINK